jgi:hypothetical protein
LDPKLAREIAIAWSSTLARSTWLCLFDRSCLHAWFLLSSLTCKIWQGNTTLLTSLLTFTGELDLQNSEMIGNLVDLSLPNLRESNNCKVSIWYFEKDKKQMLNFYNSCLV